MGLGFFWFFLRAGFLVSDFEKNSSPPIILNIINKAIPRMYFAFESPDVVSGLGIIPVVPASL